jgi:HTH-type transcriptional regulator / antitoxin HigA
VGDQKAPDSTRVRSPGDYIREELKSRGWTQVDLATILGRPLPTVNEIIQGKRAIMPEMAIGLAEAFETPAEVWMQRESLYRLSIVPSGTRDVRDRARLHQLAPIKELQKRGWLRAGDDRLGIERDLLRLLEINSLDDESNLLAAMRKSAPRAELTPAQRAWCYRVRQIARDLIVSEFDPKRLSACDRELRKVAAYSSEIRKVPKILSSYGIRYVVVEPLASGKIDGITTWLDPKSPVIGMSLRYDRIDNFWHTLCHELSHVRNSDALSIDVFDDIVEPNGLPLDVKPAIERRADQEAAEMLVPPDEMLSFVHRVSPLYSKERINQFANRIKIHPGIIVGQLQNQKEIGYSSNREMLVKIRHVITPVALTDGWGHTINQRLPE